MSKYKRAKALTKKSEIGISRAQDVMSCLEIKEDDCWRMQMNIESILRSISCSWQGADLNNPKRNTSTLWRMVVLEAS